MYVPTNTSSADLSIDLTLTNTLRIEETTE